MKRLEIPLQNVDQETIFKTCADDFEDKTALGYLESAVDISGKYEYYVPRNIENLPKYEIDAEDVKRIINVYIQKFAAKGQIGRRYYNAIMANAKGRCPICGGNKLKNLDHFLPKSEYPLLCVTPANLVPVCRDCNFDKGTYFNTNYYLLPFNPYFDDMEDVWLECDIRFVYDGTIEFEFKNGYDKTIDLNKWNKYETHINVFELNKTFYSKALEEVDNCKYGDQDLLLECGSEDVKKTLLDRKKSSERYDVNSWRSALYRALVTKVDEYCEWLKIIE